MEKPISTAEKTHFPSLSQKHFATLQKYYHQSVF
jgi:hypothetical protein